MNTPNRRPATHQTPRTTTSNTNLRQTSTSDPRTPDEESHAEQARRIQAARILQSYEQLVWFSMQRNESLVQTRIYFETILAGIATSDTKPDWPADYSASEDPKSAKEGLGRNSPAGRGKHRVASGDASEKRRRDREREKGRRSGAGLE